MRFSVTKCILLFWKKTAYQRNGKFKLILKINTKKSKKIINIEIKTFVTFN